MLEHIGTPWNDQTLIILPYWADRCQSCQGVVRALSGHCQSTVKAQSFHAIPHHSTPFHTVLKQGRCSECSTVFHLSGALWNTSQFYRCRLLVFFRSNSCQLNLCD